MIMVAHAERSRKWNLLLSLRRYEGTVIIQPAVRQVAGNEKFLVFSGRQMFAFISVTIEIPVSAGRYVSVKITLDSYECC